MSKYTCEQCEKDVDDNGPYERSDGEYECQECMEKNECAREAAYDDYMENKMDEEKLRRLDANNQDSR